MAGSSAYQMMPQSPGFKGSPAKDASSAASAASTSKLLKAMQAKLGHEADRALFDSRTAFARSEIEENNRARSEAQWSRDEQIWAAHGDRLRRTQLEREALIGGGNPINSAASVIRALK